jgi:hypothetical protein
MEGSLVLPKRKKLIKNWIDNDSLYEYFQTIAYGVSVFVTAVKITEEKTTPFFDQLEGPDTVPVIRLFFDKEDAATYADLLLNKGFDLTNMTMLEFDPIKLYKVMMRLSDDSVNKQFVVKACCFKNDKLVPIDMFYKKYDKQDVLFN